MNAALTYFERVTRLLQQVRDQELPAIGEAAEICATSIAGGGLVFLFGNGHSRMLCEEMTPRQGCFPGFVALVELALSNHANIVGTNGLRIRRAGEHSLPYYWGAFQDYIGPGAPAKPR